MKNILLFGAAILFCLLPKSATAQGEDVELVPVLSGLSSPVALACPNDGTGRLFIVSRSGTISIMQNGALLPNDFLDISAGFSLSAGGERGLLGLAFHPDYAVNGKFYVNYTFNDASNGGQLTTRISQFTVSNDANIADATSEVSLLTYAQPAGNHNGGDLHFSPVDGYLYISSGDGGGSNDQFQNGQRKDTFLGKMLRIDVANAVNGMSPPYTVPADNPFVGDSDFFPEIWAWGLRNPWRFSFDLGDTAGNNEGDMWIGDVGQSDREEVDYAPGSSTGGENYGWVCFEGTMTTTTGNRPSGTYCNDIVKTDPAWEKEYNNTFGARSITGGYVYRGADTQIYGHYVFADYANANFWTLRPDGSGGFTEHYQQDLLGQVSAFGQNETGEVFVVSLSGSLFQVRAAAALPVQLRNFKGENVRDYNRLYWSTAAEENVSHFTVEHGTDGRTFTEIGRRNAENAAAAYEYLHRDAADGTNFYRLKMTDLDGSFSYSNIVNIHRSNDVNFSVFPNPTTGEFTVFIESNSMTDDLTLEVFDNFGKRVFSETREGVLLPTEESYSLSADLPRGIYVLHILIGNGVSKEMQMILK